MKIMSGELISELSDMQKRLSKLKHTEKNTGVKVERASAPTQLQTTYYTCN